MKAIFQIGEKEGDSDSGFSPLNWPNTALLSCGPWIRGGKGV